MHSTRSHAFLFFALLAAATLSGAGCSIKKPTLTFKSARLTEVDLEGATLQIDYTLKNPNPLELKLASVSYALEVEGKSVVSGQPKKGLTVKKKGTSVLSFPARIKYLDLAATVLTFFKKDKASYRAHGSVGVQTPIGVITLPISYSNTFAIPKLPEFDFQTPTIRSLSLTGASVVIPVRVKNKNDFPLPLKNFSANVAIAGVQVGRASARLPQDFKGQAAETVELPIDLNFAKTGKAVFSALKNKKAKVELDGAFESGESSFPVTLAKMLGFQSK